MASPPVTQPAAPAVLRIPTRVPIGVSTLRVYVDAELWQERTTLLMSSPEDQVYRVQIDDDGSGFTPADNGSAPGHLGLTTMRERAQIAGGWWKLESRPGAGTSVTFWLPVVAEPSPASVTASTIA